jgi:hypothetical protein
MANLQTPTHPGEELKENVASMFCRLRDEWARDTLMSSDGTAIVTHPAYYGIIGLGPDALPYIFEDLQNGGGPWFVALQAITHTDLTSHENAVDARKLREDWLAWGRRHGYVAA